MNAAIQPILLVVDDNLADIALLETAWMHAGHDKTIGIFVCNSYDEAMVWLRDDIPHSYVISGVLVDLMLRDGVGTAAECIADPQRCPGDFVDWIRNWANRYGKHHLVVDTRLGKASQLAGMVRLHPSIPPIARCAVQVIAHETDDSMMRNHTVIPG